MFQELMPLLAQRTLIVRQAYSSDSILLAERGLMHITLLRVLV